MYLTTYTLIPKTNMYLKMMIEPIKNQKQKYTNKYRGELRGYGSNSHGYFPTDYDKIVKQTRETFEKNEFHWIYISSWLSIPSDRKRFRTEIMFT